MPVSGTYYGRNSWFVGRGTVEDMVVGRTERFSRVRRLLASVLAGVLVGSVITVAGAGVAAAQDYMPGIDVSHHQGSIDWTKVAESGQRYVFQKATEGATITDPTYGTNRAGAGAASIPFGAYHFAFAQGGTISAAQADAVSEANHFLSVAQPAPGDLVPVLDLEKNPEGMPPRRLKAWTQAWLDHVESALGVKPLVYTNPNFWETQLNNTETFALQGFPLWIAHYTSAASPRVPGTNWGGQGWAFWQYTSCSSVPGIAGCVDANRYPGVDLTPYVIPGAPEPEPTPEPAVAPSNTAPPEITGTPEVGRTLTASSGTWSGSQPQAYSYAWFRCSAEAACQALSGATEPSYVVKSGDFGHQMRVTVTATNSAGSAEATSAPTAIVADATPPDAPRVTKPKRSKLLSTRIGVAWQAVEPDAIYDVRYRQAVHGASFAPARDLVSGTDATSATLKGAAGDTFCFSARATDLAGNTSGWSQERCTTVALDDRDLKASSGWAKRSGRGFYLRTFMKTKRKGARLVAKDVRVEQLNIVVQRCRGCGRVAVLFNGNRVGAAKLGARRTRNKRVIRIADFGRVRSGKVQIVVLSRGAPVKIDGLALYRDS